MLRVRHLWIGGFITRDFIILDIVEKQRGAFEKQESKSDEDTSYDGRSEKGC